MLGFFPIQQGQPLLDHFLAKRPSKFEKLYAPDVHGRAQQLKSLPAKVGKLRLKQDRSKKHFEPNDLESRENIEAITAKYNFYK